MIAKNLYHAVDRATDISLTEIKELQKNFGCNAFGFYVDGPSEYHAWSPSSVKSLMQNGFHALPIYVPRQHGVFENPVTDAQKFVKELQRYEIPVHKPRFSAVVDIEYDTFDNNPVGCVNYCGAFADELFKLGYAPVIYGTVRTILACDKAGINAGFWAAAPITNHFDGSLRPRQLINVLNLKTMGKQGRFRGWQYAFEVGGYDLNVWRGILAKVSPK